MIRKDSACANPTEPALGYGLGMVENSASNLAERLAEALYGAAEHLLIEENRPAELARTILAVTQAARDLAEWTTKLRAAGAEEDVDAVRSDVLARARLRP